MTASRRRPGSAERPEPTSSPEALAEAAHTAAMAYRLVPAVNDAVRRATRKRLTCQEEELGEDASKMAPGWSADQLRGRLGDDALAVLMQDTDRPRMARQLVGLQQAAVDLATFLPQMGRLTAGVHQAVTANAARIRVEGADHRADLTHGASAGTRAPAAMRTVLCPARPTRLAAGSAPAHLFCARRLQGQAAGQVDAFVTGQLTSESGEHYADSFFDP